MLNAPAPDGDGLAEAAKVALAAVARKIGRDESANTGTAAITQSLAVATRGRMHRRAVLIIVGASFAFFIAVVLWRYSFGPSGTAVRRARRKNVWPMTQ